MFTSILWAVLIVGGLGLLFGIILAVCSELMRTPKDDVLIELEEILPGANCGACGYSGCTGYAKALFSGDANTNLCMPGGEEVAFKISKTLGKDGGSFISKYAVISCKGDNTRTSKAACYDGIKTCAAANGLYQGGGECRFGCIGYGDCKEACKYGAISIKDGIVVIDKSKCTGCSLCVTSCPKNLISMVEDKKTAFVKCSNCHKGIQAKNECTAACFGCGLCKKVCEYDAIEIKDNCAVIDADKCTGCGMCVDACKMNCIEIL